MYTAVELDECTWWCVVSLVQSKELKRFKDKLKEEEKLALKTAELQAPKDGKKQYMNGVKVQSNSRRLKKVRGWVAMVVEKRGKLDLPWLQEQEFTSKQAQSLDQELKRILDEQKEERKLLELRFLDAQQDLKRSKFIHSCLCS